MKVAYHFKCGDIQGRYDSVFYELVFNKLLRLNEPFISSKILIGDLLIYDYLRQGNNPSDFLNYLFQVKGDIWRRIVTDKVKYFIEDTAFVICFETIPKELATKLNDSLANEERYVGALEIDNSLELHWWLYRECIGPKFRLLNKEINILIDDNEPESLEYVEDIKQRLKGIPFDNINTEFSNYRHSSFDDKHNYEKCKKSYRMETGNGFYFYNYY